MKSFNIEFSPRGSKEIFVLKYYNIKVQLKFGDGDGDGPKIYFKLFLTI